jgi:transcription termination factor NusB
MKSIMELFRGDAVKFFGIDKCVLSVAPTELYHIQVQKNINDWVLYADDDSYIHFEFQSDYSKKDLTRFMVSDAMLYYNEGKPIKTIVVYSADIEETITTLDADSITYQVDAFHMSKLDGDQTYESIKTKIDAGDQLTKQDLMSIVFLTLMKNSVDKATRIEQSVELSKKLSNHDEQAQIQAMLGLLAEKFIKDPDELKRLKELISMGIIAEMIRDDAMIEIARKLLIRGISVKAVSEDTGLSETIIRSLQAEIAS